MGGERSFLPGLFPFKEQVRKDVFEAQGGECDICGRRTHLEGHHRVPIRALRGQGIRGTNAPSNCVGLCGPPKDCHEVADRMAIDRRLFWNGEKFVPILEMPQEDYILGRMPQTRPRHEHQHHQHHTGRRR